MEYKFDDWIQKLTEFKNSIEKDLYEVRKQKAEVEQMKAELLEEFSKGKYIRDDRRIVISAPEIIIGNVDKNGNMLDETGSVTLKGVGVILNGISTAGTVTTYAPSIRQIAVDTGLDGNESVVGTISEIVCQAKSVGIQASLADGVFAQQAETPGKGSISLRADATIDLSATKSSKTLKDALEERIAGLDAEKVVLTEGCNAAKERVDTISGKMKTLLQKADDNRGNDNQQVQAKYTEVVSINQELSVMMPDLTNAMENYSQMLSRLAEVNRQKKALTTAKDAIVTGDDFKNKTTGTFIALNSESVLVKSTDGEGNLRDNAEAKVSITANKVDVGARELDGSLKDKGEILLNAKTIDVSTASTKKKGDDGKEAECQALGDVTITSKTVTVKAVDSDIKDKKATEKALTKDSMLNIRMENTSISATDTEGKATGTIKLNSKLIAVEAMDVDREKRTDTELAKDGEMTILSEKMFIGSKDKKVQSKQLQVASEEVGFFVKDTLEAQQGEKKAVLQLTGGKASLSGSETQLFGKTTINNATTVTGELTAPKGAIDDLTVSKKYQGPNMADGLGAGQSKTSNLSTVTEQKDGKKIDEQVPQEKKE